MSILMTFLACNTQIKNATTERVKIHGNCGMCERTIEEAGQVKREAAVDWDADTQMAVLTYDPQRTNRDEILKRIALAGYDSDQYLAPKDAYAALPACCQYDRTNKTDPMHSDKMKDHSDHQNDNGATANKTESEEADRELKEVYDHYFALKDALVKTDGREGSARAGELLNALNAVKMNELSHEAHMVWMDVKDDLVTDTKQMAGSNDVEHQRGHFVALSDNLYQLMKVSGQESPTYYQHCPMANDGEGANWLSKESVVKNPYYGSKMLSCGKTVETLE